MNYFSQLSVLRQSRVFTSVDPDETQEHIGRILQPNKLTPVADGEQHRAHMDSIRLPGLSLSAIFCGNARGEVPDLTCYDIICCIKGSGEIVHSGRAHAISSMQAVVCPPGSTLQETLPRCEQLVVRLERPTIEPYLDGDVLRAMQPTLDLSRPALGPWLSTVRSLVADQNLHSLLAKSSLLAIEYEGMFLRLLLAGMVHDFDLPQPHGASPAAVRRAEEFIAANIMEPLTLPLIARASGTSVRTLHRTFQQFRGCSPMERVREMRLEQAYLLLRSPDTDENVAQVALACGFGHLGRFSGAYLARFHEHPHETLKRTRSMRRDAMRLKRVSL
ncbi:MAG TPA: AraC family transcriptional regulator [Allosphingosinicella sp.]|nr:AraC family transcriptional regulator [Allosphingosinicella sp.]